MDTALTHSSPSEWRASSSGKKGQPLYREISEHFRLLITCGEIGNGALLPSEQDICDQFRVSRITARRALNELARTGLVSRGRGRGTIVTHDVSAPMIKAGFDQLIGNLAQMGVETQVRLLRVSTVNASADLSRLMEIEPGEKVQRIVRMRLLDGKPFSHLVTHIPFCIAAGFTRRDLESATLIELLDKAGRRPVSASQTITAIAPDRDVAERLELGESMPLLKVHRLMRDRSKRVVQEITALYRGDRYEYHMSMLRRSTSNWSIGD